MTLSRLFTLSLCTMLAATAASAQDFSTRTATVALPTTASIAPTVDAVAPASFAPVLGHTAAGITTARSAALPAPLKMDGDRGNSVAMMIVGSAIMVAGALVDGTAGTIILIAGGVVAISGLWHYLQ
jgi:hypothetical protein